MEFNRLISFFIIADIIGIFELLDFEKHDIVSKNKIAVNIILLVIFLFIIKTPLINRNKILYKFII